MSMFKKLTALATAAVVALGIMVPVTFASNLPEDVIGTKYEESAELLQALKIMVGDKDTGEFRLEDNILRSEVAKVAVTMAGLGEVAENSMTATQFPDVVADHWARGYINVAHAQGYVIGDDVGTFRPDDTITFAEAAAIFNRVLGYNFKAEANGGFPTGHLITAGDNGVTKGGISAGPDTKATRGMISMMSFNSLTINLMEKIYGTDERWEETTKTLLKDKLEVTRQYGQLVANNQSTLTGPSTLKANEVQIKVGDKTEIYTTENLDTRSLLGRNVIFYVRTSDRTSEQTVLLIRNDKVKNTDLTVLSTNIEDLVDGRNESEKVLKYRVNKEDRKTTDATILADAKIFYNGVAATETTLDKLTEMTSGNVVLLDTTNSDKYNYVFITEYQNMVVDEVAPLSHKISDKFGQLSLTLDPKDKDLKFMITKDGKEIGIEDINEWDILSVTVDEKKTVINVYVCDETVTGKVTIVSEDRYTINDKEYEAAANLITEAGETAPITLNDEGIFYLDIEGKIAAVDTTVSIGSNYAYLVNAKETTAIDSQLEMQLYGVNGETSRVMAASKVKINDQAGYNAANALTALKEANGGKIAQLITFEKNAKGEIYYINTATNASNAGKYNKEFSLDYKSDSTGLAYNSASKKLGNFNVGANTIILDIPTGETDPDNYAVRTRAMFVDKSSYEVEIYDLSEDMTAKIVIVKDSQNVVNREGSIAVVNKIVKTQNADSVKVDMLYGYQDGEAIQIAAKDELTLVKGGNTLQAGDVIQYQTNARGEIDKITVLFDSADRNNTSVNIYKPFEGTEMQTVIGRVDRKFANSINLRYKASEDAETDTVTNFDISNATVYSYDYSMSYGLQVSVADSSYITKYDDADPQKVFLRIYKGEVVEIVIIQES